MSINKHSFDEQLKQQMEQFAPDAPDVWNTISQSLSQTTATATTATTAAKSAFGIAKLVTVVATIAAVSAGIYFASVSTDDMISPAEVTTQQKDVNTYLEQTAETKPVQPETEQPLSTKISVPARVNERNNNQRTTPISESDGNPSEVMIQAPSHPIKQSENNAATAVRNELPKQETNTVVKNTASYGVKEQPARNANAIQTEEQQHQELEMYESIERSIPNVFTPNNDGMNDEFVIGFSNVESFTLKIVNRLGKVVFETNTLDTNWNGNIQNIGEPCEAGDYAYVLKYQLKNAAVRNLNGKVKLIR